MRLRDNIQSVKELYHWDLIVTGVVLGSPELKKYPGIHVAQNANGMVNMIFHAGIPMVRARKNFA